MWIHIILGSVWLHRDHGATGDQQTRLRLFQARQRGQRARRCEGGEVKFEPSRTNHSIIEHCAVFRTKYWTLMMRDMVRYAAKVATSSWDITETRRQPEQLSQMESGTGVVILAE